MTTKTKKANGTLIKEYLRNYPDAPKQTLAKLLREEFPLNFPSVEAARSAVRYHTGASGKANRKRVTPENVDLRPPSTLKIPRGVKQNQAPLKIRTTGKWLVCSDWHVPYHDEKALEACLRFAMDQKVDHLYLNGDLVDFYKSSKWCSDPKARNLFSELKTLWEILDQLKGRFDRKVYKIGNHEDRFTRRIWSSTPELAVLPRFDVDQVLEVKERGFEVLDSKRHAKMGGLHIFHGHEMSQGFIAPVNVARGLWVRTNSSSLSGHWHRTSTHIEKSGLGSKTNTCYSLGCLCDLSPEYAPVNKWNHGFAIIDLQDSVYNVSNYLVEDGKVYSAG